MKQTRTITLNIARELFANVAMGCGPIRDWRVRRGRTMTRDLAAKVQHILDQHTFFAHNLGEVGIAGKTIIEIGPGDAIPHAMLFLARGAAGYVAIDRFFPKAITPQAK
jgi:hypothetical protein